MMWGANTGAVCKLSRFQVSGLRRAVAATAAQAGVRALLGFRGQRSENREPQNIEYRMLNIEGKKTSSFEILDFRSRL
jgi:hypothetical protein